MADSPTVVPAIDVDDGVPESVTISQHTSSAPTATSPIIQTEMTDDGQPAMTARDKLLATQRKYANLLRQQRDTAKQAEVSPDVSSPPPSTAYSKPAKDLTAVSFAKAKATAERKKRAGTLTLHEEIEWMQTAAAEAARLRKIKADAEYDRSPTPEPAGIFVSEEDSPEPPPRFRCA